MNQFSNGQGDGTATVSTHRRPENLEGITLEKWRLIPEEVGDGASHMALDQALLESAVEEDFPPTLRFFRWEPPALSLGRFQDLGQVDLKACETSGIEVVRRPTGGRSILHLDDFTYSLVLPSRLPLPDGVVETYSYICRGIVAALRLLGVEAQTEKGTGSDYTRAGGACFATSTGADLKCAGRKICGSAQLRRNGAVLQHGSLLLKDRSELLFHLLRFENPAERAASLEAYRRSCVTLEEVGIEVGWEEVATCFRRGFEESFGVRLVKAGLTTQEERRWHCLVPAYRSRDWLTNPRRNDLPSVPES